MKKTWREAELIRADICDTADDNYRLDSLSTGASGQNVNNNVCQCGNPKHHWNGNGYGHSISNGLGHTNKKH